MSEQLEPLATEAGQLAIVRAINNLSSLEYAVRAEHAATAAALSADDALTSATNASNSETKARDWAEKTNGAVETETIITPSETEGDPPTEELVSYFSAKYWALMAEDYFSQMAFDTVPTEDSTNGITSGAVYDALATKQDTLTFDNAPTQNSVNPVKSGGVYSALDTKADKSTTYTKTEVDTALSNVQGQLTFDSTPTANSTNPVTSGGIYTALQNVEGNSNIFTLKTHSNDVSISSDSDYYVNTAGLELLYVNDRKWYKINNIPAICGYCNKNGYWTPILISLNPDGVKGYCSYNTSAIFVSEGTIHDSVNNIDWYYTSLETAYPTNNSVRSASVPLITGLFSSALSAAESLLLQAEPELIESLISEDLFNPTNYVLADGDTITSGTLKGLIAGYRPIKINGVTFLPSDYDSTNQIYTYYAILNGTTATEIQKAQIDSSWEISLTTEDIGGGSGIGGAGNASGVVREELYNGTPQGNGTLLLSDTIDKYDFIEFRVVNNTSNMVHHLVPCYISVPLLLKTKLIDTGGSNTNMYIQYEYGNRWAGIQVNASDNSKLTITNAADHLIKEVYGIKFSKNLSEQMYSNVLYENSSGWSSGSITLNDSLENYDFITLEGFLDGENPKNYFSDILFLNTINHAENNRFVFTRDAGRYICFSITDYRQLTVTASSKYKIDRIVGHKMAKGGYSGIVTDARMTVKSGTVTMDSGVSSNSGIFKSVVFDSPMPDTNYVVLITPMNGTYGYASGSPCATEKTVNGFKIYVWGNGGVRDPMIFDWIAIRPNSYTREGMVEDVLFSNTSGVNSGTINLSGNISDYDLISFQLSYTGSTENYKTETMPSSRLVDKTSNDTILFLMFSNGDKRWCKIKYDTDSSLTLLPCDTGVVQTNEKLKITKIIGIKFGRYVSGVAVDTTVTQNSNAVVTSGAVYDALQNIPSGGGGGGSSSVSCGFDIPSGGDMSVSNFGGLSSLPNYYIEGANAFLYTQGGASHYKRNSYPAFAVMTRRSDDWYFCLLLSDRPEGVVQYASGRGDHGYDGTYEMQDGTILYYSVEDYTEARYTSITTNLQSLRNYTKYSNWQTAVANFIEDAHIIKGIQFTISSSTIQDLVEDMKPFKINGLVCYPTKHDSTNYYYSYYDNVNKQINYIEIHSDWSAVITLVDLEQQSSPSITVDSSITQNGTNPVEGGAIYTALDGKADKSTTYTKTEVDTALGNKQGTLTFDTTPTADSANPVTSGGVYTALLNIPTGTGDVTTDTDQNITGTKTFVGSKKVGFKQSTANDKLGFTLFGNTGTERGYLEFNPTNTVDGVTGLMTLGNYATSAAGLTQVGFRRYSNISGASGAYNLLMPMVADARTPFSLTTTYQNFYLPLGFTDGTTTVRTAKSGLVDLSPLLASLEARIAALEGN